MKSKIIKKFVLELGGKTVELSPEQARELFDSLEELFGKRVIREYHDYYRWNPRPWYRPYETYMSKTTPFKVSAGTPDVKFGFSGFKTTAGSQLSERNGTVMCKLSS